MHLCLKAQPLPIPTSSGINILSGPLVTHPDFLQECTTVVPKLNQCNIDNKRTWSERFSERRRYLAHLDQTQRAHDKMSVCDGLG